MKARYLISLAASALLPMTAGAVRALETLRTVTQPDGTTLRVKLVGDEHYHYLLTEDDCLLAEVGDAYYFGRLTPTGKVVATLQPAASPLNRTAAQKAAAFRVDANTIRVMGDTRTTFSPRRVAQEGMGLSSNTFPSKGDVRALVVLVEYQDVKFTLEDPLAYFNGLYNTDGFSEYNATGCAAEYFRENSGGQFRPVFDVYGPVTLSKKRYYYGQNDHYGMDVHPEEMVLEAVEALDPTVDFSKYDMDGDGFVDNIFVVYAGRGEATGGGAMSVWPHSWKLSYTDQAIEVDGVTVDSYGCTNEMLETRPDGVGTFIHEFSHVIGLPDLYSTGQYLTCTPGPWSVLDYGPYNNDGCTPPNYSTFERLALGWIDPMVIREAASVTLTDLAATNVAALIETPVESEYYLFENRQQSGWDTYLPGHGMLIWHVDYLRDVFEQNIVNNNILHQYVELKKASDVKNAYTDDLYCGWVWPGTEGVTSFTDDTAPSMKSWDGARLGLPITDIREENGLIHFNVAGGDSSVAEISNALLRVNGLTVTHPDGSVLRLYDLSGRLVDSGAGSVTAPTSGFYLVETSSGVHKLLLR